MVLRRTDGFNISDIMLCPLQETAGPLGFIESRALDKTLIM